MGYLPAVVVVVVGLLIMVGLVVVLVGHLRRFMCVARELRATVAASTVSLRSGAAAVRARRAGGA